ncbi:MAG: hypothetical protein GAK30_03715 [Paracidovorax wautersii]|uniref:Uncharacterized protein n=1 Tax=Paracidovorax wautersii TaxID=1177982 RepID=A0A7V8FKJ6_9BURK|nr:MAG: hypothetical protein GAK30_03715 [Paracidovorax wautersii]
MPLRHLKDSNSGGLSERERSLKTQLRWHMALAAIAVGIGVATLLALWW